jgi:hypothetical protein
MSSLKYTGMLGWSYCFINAKISLGRPIVDIIFDDTMVYIYICYLHLYIVVPFSILGVSHLLCVLSGMISLAHIVSLLINTFTLCTLSTLILLIFQLCNISYAVTNAVVRFVFFHSKCSLLCIKPFSVRKYQLSAKSNDDRSHTLICIHVTPDLPEGTAHSDHLAHVQTLWDKDLRSTEFAIRYIVIACKALFSNKYSKQI